MNKTKAEAYTVLLLILVFLIGISIISYLCFLKAKSIKATDDNRLVEMYDLEQGKICTLSNTEDIIY